MNGYKRNVKAVIFLTCLSFVIWQCYMAFQKLLEKPRATSVTVEYAKDWPAPSFTVCPTNEFLRRNEDVLDDCGFKDKYVIITLFMM